MFDFKKFPVYILSNRVYKNLIPVFYNKKVNPNLKYQLKRASSSILLNIVEGAGKFSKNDKKNFYSIAGGSTNECVAILDILKPEDIITEKEYNDLCSGLLEINKMLSGLVNKMMEK